MSKTSPKALTGSPDAKRKCALLLETLGGMRTTTECSTALSINLTQYYILECRALQAMIDVLEPRPRGRTVRPEKQLEKLGKEKRGIERELRRYQALYRSVQRTVGIEEKPGKTAKTRRRRKQGRGEKLIQALSEQATATMPESSGAQ